MLIALTIWNGRLATVADFCQRLRLVEVDQGRIVAGREIEAPGKDAAHWCVRLAAEGVSTLICGAITRHLAQRLDSGGITVVDGCAGPADEVLTAWLAGTVEQLRWRMPGCHRHRWRGARQRCGYQRGRTRLMPVCQQPSATETLPMRIAISTTGHDLDAALDPRFGRTRHLVVCDGETITHHDNPPAVNAEHGAGIKTAEFVASLGVQAVISGAVGPKAMQVLRAAGIRAYASSASTARAALAELRTGALSEVS